MLSRLLTVSSNDRKSNVIKTDGGPSMATKREITVTVNGQEYHSQVEPRLLLVHYLRDVLDLTGTHIGCDTSQCGACTVLINGESAKACTVLAVQADGDRKSVCRERV